MTGLSEVTGDRWVTMMFIQIPFPLEHNLSLLDVIIITSVVSGPVWIPPITD